MARQSNLIADVYITKFILVWTQSQSSLPYTVHVKTCNSETMCYFVNMLLTLGCLYICSTGSSSSSSPSSPTTTMSKVKWTWYFKTFCFLRSAQLLQYFDEFSNFFGRLTGNQIPENQQRKFTCAAEREKGTTCTSEVGLPAMFVVLNVFIEKTRCMQWNDWGKF